MNICIYAVCTLVAFQVIRLIKFEIGYRKRIKGLRNQWVEICKTAERQQKEYFEMMKTDDGLRTAYNNALNTVFNN